MHGMRLLKVTLVMIVGPMMGLTLGFVTGGLLLPSDPTGGGSPGDGALLLLCTGYGILLSVPLSALYARRIWRRSVRKKTQVVD